jgi:hypothetical protein
MVPVRRPGELRSTLPAASATASGATAPEGGEAGRRVDVGLVRNRGLDEAGVAGVVIDGGDPDVGGLRQRADAADDRRERVVRERADVVPGGRELVRAAGDRRVRVVDDLEHVGVLEEEAPRAGALEAVAEGPDAAGVGVRDRADRADAKVTARVAGRDRAAGSQRLHGEAPERPGGHGDHGSPDLLAGLLERAPEARRHAADGQRARERLHALAVHPADRGPRASAPRVRRLRRVDRVGEHDLDRRREDGLAAVVADRLRDRADVPLHAVAVRTVDRRAAEARADPGGVDRRSGHGHDDARTVGPRLGVHDVDHLDVERADRRSADDRVAGALHAGPHLRQGHDGIPGEGGRGGNQ